MRSVYTYIELNAVNPPAAIIAYINNLPANLLYGIVTTAADLAGLPQGFLTLPVGAVSAEILTDGCYFFPDRNGHTPETYLGIIRLTAIDLEGDMRIGVYAFLPEAFNVAHIRVNYA